MGGELPPQISVAVGVTVGLLASFVQSLGLTIQRKSHLQNEELPPSLRIKDYKRPLWIIGFTIFICSNLLGTIFQIGALPIVVLGPLGAVSLLYNAFFAKIILGDEFSIYLIAGTFLIAGGAVLIGIFGVVPEQTHTLEELVKLYSRPAFIIWISLLSFSLVVFIGVAHFTEWTFERKLNKSSIHLSPTPDGSSRRRASSLWKTRRPTALHTQSAPIPQYGAFEDILPRTRPNLALKRGSSPGPEEVRMTKAVMSEQAVERTRLILGVAYGSVSGTLSGLCLLFAKTGIELLILTVVGQNQFGHYQAWLIVLVLLVAAVLQLFYLNRALRLVGPTLICPLAFCFYNLSSIISGLIYYDQWDMLSPLQFALVSLGTVILLGGVWIVSIQAPKKDGKEKVSPRPGTFTVDMTDEPEGESSSGEDSSDREQVDWLPRGLTIGLGAASPGFEVRPAAHKSTPTHHRRHVRGHTVPSFSSVHIDGDLDAPLLSQRTASDTDMGAASDELSRRRKAKQRGFSISGALYVGQSPSHRAKGSESVPVTPLANRQDENDSAEDSDGPQGNATPRKSWRNRA